MNKNLWKILKAHRGHNVTITCYGDWENPDDICVECEDCGEVLISARDYELVSVED